jgi:hypothetical protein
MPTINRKVSWTTINPIEIKIGDVIRFFDINPQSFSNPLTVIGVRKTLTGVYLKYKNVKHTGYVEYGNRKFLTERRKNG